MKVEAHHIAQAHRRLEGIALSRGEDSDPAETLRIWRDSEGISSDGLEEASAKSAQGSIADLRAQIAEGAEVSLHDIEELIRYEFSYAFQLGWICRARAETRSDEEIVREAADAPDA
jgi:hypothetical protein